MPVVIGKKYYDEERIAPTKRSSAGPPSKQSLQAAGRRIEPIM
jgi:hypothetical protein